MEGIEHKTVKVNGINMHVAEKGKGPVILFLHGFPELWYSWRHQILALSSLGYRAVAPDLRGFGDTNAPESVTSYTCFHIVGDLVALLDVIAPEQDKVFVVGHDWGALMAWYLSLFRPDKVKALLNLSVPFIRFSSEINPLDIWKNFFGNDYYMYRFQEPGQIEDELAEVGTERAIKEFLTDFPVLLPKGNLFGDGSVRLPSWLSEEEANYYVTKYEQKGFTGGINYYRNLPRYGELLAPWVGCQVKVPAKFIMGDKDLVNRMPGMKEYIHSDEFKKDVPLLQEVVIMEGVSHFINMEKPEEINKHIYDFFRQFD